MVKDPPANAGEAGSIPGLGRSPGGGNGNPLQFSCLENPTDTGAWEAIAHGVTRSQTRLKRLSMHAVSMLGAFLHLYLREPGQTAAQLHSSHSPVK